jgi:peptidoglycan/xylan/chitin deacetylase (PgdA/CDA1 family)
MADLLDKHGLNGTFFVPINNREGIGTMSPSQIRELGCRFEIGSHTYDHIQLNRLDQAQAHYQITAGNRCLEDMLGRKVNGFCYPGGKYRRRDAELVKASGFIYARTTVNLHFDVGRTPFELPTTVQFYPHARSLYLRNFATAGNWGRRYKGLRLALRHRHWMDRLYTLFEHACERGAPFHLWGHSWEVDRLDAWNELDRFFAHVAATVPPRDRINNEQLAARYFQTHEHNGRGAHCESK